MERLFTDIERAKADGKPTPATMASTYAKRFAAKEACAKALGLGIKEGVAFKDMSVINLPSGQPTLQLTGKAKERLDFLTPAGMTSVIHVTMTDDYPYAQAFVVIEAIS
jgi:holo-[acyl-carrier protein] synthase